MGEPQKQSRPTGQQANNGEKERPGDDACPPPSIPATNLEGRKQLPCLPYPMEIDRAVANCPTPGRASLFLGVPHRHRIARPGQVAACPAGRSVPGQQRKRQALALLDKLPGPEARVRHPPAKPFWARERKNCTETASSLQLQVEIACKCGSRGG
jgi:hypothetical protein